MIQICLAFVAGASMALILSNNLIALQIFMARIWPSLSLHVFQVACFAAVLGLIYTLQRLLPWQQGPSTCQTGISIEITDDDIVKGVVLHSFPDSTQKVIRVSSRYGGKNWTGCSCDRGKHHEIHSWPYDDSHAESD